MFSGNNLRNNIGQNNNNNIVTPERFNNDLNRMKNFFTRYGVNQNTQNDFFDACNNLYKVYQDKVINQNNQNEINININTNQNNQNVAVTVNNPNVVVTVNNVPYQNININSNHNNNTIPSANQNSNRYINPNLGQNSNRYAIPSFNQNSNRQVNQINLNQNINSRVNNSNVAQNNIYNSNVLFNTTNLSDFDKKKDDLFVEMDQYQYKHIQKYDGRRETECAICLEEFKRNDIIKEFYKCKHIFHKDCLKNWLKRSNVCPLCKHDLTEDINKMH